MGPGRDVGGIREEPCRDLWSPVVAVIDRGAPTGRRPRSPHARPTHSGTPVCARRAGTMDAAAPEPLYRQRNLLILALPWLLIALVDAVLRRVRAAGVAHRLDRPFAARH